jgi:hypothetical protein
MCWFARGRRIGFLGRLYGIVRIEEDVVFVFPAQFVFTFH